MLHALRSPLLLALTFLLPAGLPAQRPEFFRVTDVRFSLERSPYGGDAWFAMEVFLEVRDNPDPSAPNREFIDDFQVEVALAHNVGVPARPVLEYFWSRVELPTLEQDDHRLRFYLPPEQVERGRMGNSEPYAWFVQVSQGRPAAGEPPLHTIVAVSRALREQPRLDRFHELLEEQRDARAGILLPQAETPFRDAFPEETPAIRGMRRDIRD